MKSKVLSNVLSLKVSQESRLGAAKQEAWDTLRPNDACLGF